MRFDRLLWECLCPGKYEFEESNIQVALAPSLGETVLTFHIDTEAFRDWKAGVKACDLLIFYRGPARDKPVLLFVELKGSNFEDAEGQIASAVKRTFDHLDAACQPQVYVCAVVVLGTAPPINTKQRIKDLRQQTGLVFKYHFNARKQRADLRTNLADAAPRAQS